ncbi:bacterial regulatory s, gntR family protein [Acinetobacter baumannii 1546444]|nr:bacterial regulatory s, gntR family protein [Acinetobacter baumannii 1546444]
MQDLTFAPEPLQSQGRTLTEHVFKQIQTAIVLGQIPAGSKISEPELARTYGISRGPLREAIHRLEGQRLVSVLHMWARAWFRSHCNSLKSFTKFGLL